MRYYFGAETGLLRRKVGINQAAVLPIPELVDFEDYRDVDGVKLPFIVRRSAIDTYDSWTRTFAEIKRNLAVDDAFIRSAGCAALVRQCRQLELSYELRKRH